MSNLHPDQRKGCGGAAMAIVVILALIGLGCVIFVGGCMGMFLLG